MKNLILFIAIFLSIQTTSVFSQKFGYLNSAQLLMLMPEVKTADTNLKTFQDQLISKGEAMAKALQADYEKYVQEAQSGTLSQIDAQKREAGLTKQQQQISEYETVVAQKVQKKREELYGPILDKVNTAIQKVGKNKGYSFIFDSSVMNLLLFADESEDIMPLVKAELGL